MAVIGCRAWNTLCSPINPPVLFAACQASADSTHSQCRCGRDAPPPASSPHRDRMPFAQRSGRVAPVREWAAGADLRSHTLQQELGAQLLPVLIAYTRVLSRGAVSTSVSARLRVGKMGGVVWGWHRSLQRGPCRGLPSPPSSVRAQAPGTRPRSPLRAHHSPCSYQWRDRPQEIDPCTPWGDCQRQLHSEREAAHAMEGQR